MTESTTEQPFRGGQNRLPTVKSLLAMAAVVALATVAVLVVLNSARDMPPVGYVALGALAIGTLVAGGAVPLLLRERRAREAAERRAAAAEQRAGRAEARAAETGERRDAALAAHDELSQELEHLAATRLPAALEQARSPEVPVPVPGPLHPGDEANAARCERVLELAAAAVTRGREAGDAGGAAVVRAVTAEGQALSYRLQDLLLQLEERTQHDEQLFDLVQRADRLNETSRSLLQRAGIAAGGTARLVREDCHIPDLVAGALSRIEGGERVTAHNLMTRRLGVVAPAAEPVAVILAELLRNAAHYSPGTLGVQVTLHEVPGGAVVTIDDSGLGMGPDALANARRMITGEPPLLAVLGDPPRLGLAAVGRMARPHGLRIDWEPSAYGGVRTVVHLPTAVLTLIPEEVPMSAVAPPPRQAPEAPGPDAVGEEAPLNLPRRRRRSADTDEAGVAKAAPAVALTPPSTTPEAAGQRYSGLQRAVNAARSQNTVDTAAEEAQ